MYSENGCVNAYARVSKIVLSPTGSCKPLYKYVKTGIFHLYAINTRRVRERISVASLRVSYKALSDRTENIENKTYY